MPRKHARPAAKKRAAQLAARMEAQAGQRSRHWVLPRMHAAEVAARMEAQVIAAFFGAPARMLGRDRNGAS